MILRSPAFEHGQRIPKRFTEDGTNTSPPLAWGEEPPEAKELALVVEDPDAPTKEPWVHWLMYRIPATVIQLPEGIPRDPVPPVPPGARQGQNGWGPGSLGWRGPAPPKGHGTHHYWFRLYALARPLDIEPGVVKDGLVKAMERAGVLAEAELMGTYER